MTGRAEMLSEAKTTDYTKLLSTEAGLRAVTRWFLQRDILTQFSLARIMDYAKPRRRGRRLGTYVDGDDGNYRSVLEAHSSFWRKGDGHLLEKKEFSPG
ncbi:hypothetical protein Q7P35_008958 [Cladosporium inversicolor]